MTFFLNDCSRNALIEREKITISDTTWNYVKMNDTIWIPFPLNDTIYKPEYVQVSIPIKNRTDSLRHYTGMYAMDFGNIIWSADVSGFLEQISFSGDVKIPQINNTKIGTITKTVEITKLPRWNLYGGLQGSAFPNYFEIGPSINLRLGKLQYGYSYGLLNNTHSVNIQTKIF
ncbi:hypothetical protein [Marivirga sp.]|uniref:hypothetical protein n=1 Tax=Marivirga sp. TaxID=2018662 RepID=UPI003DA75F1C